jgi:hypothetical protein
VSVPKRLMAGIHRRLQALAKRNSYHALRCVPILNG